MNATAGDAPDDGTTAPDGAPTPAPASGATRSSRRRAVPVAAASVGALVVAALVVGAIVVSRPGEPQATPTTSSTPPPATPSLEPTLAAVPPAVSPETLNALPLAFYDAVIPDLLDGGSVTPANQWQTATPRAPLVPLYARPDADAVPIGTFAATVPTINTAAATAVWGVSPGVDGGMILISTPSRNRTPGDGGIAEAPSATFAWARASDFTLAAIGQTVVVDSATSVVSIVGPDGTVGATETARLGTPGDPTPAGTSTYMEANYVDRTIAYTQGNPIALTGAHSALLPGYGGNSALTALHYYPDPTGSSHGCVRVSAAMTAALAALPVGTPIQFT